MNINRGNYETFFLLYIDNELSNTEKNAVELFVQQNPDLKLELEMLSQSVLPITNSCFDKKDLLLKVTENEQQLLMLHLDNELNISKAAEIKQLLASNIAIKKELEILLQTKLPVENIEFKNKQSLYRKESSKVISIKWWRVAAAILILLGSSLILILSRNNTVTKNGEVVIQTPDTNNKIISPNNATVNTVDVHSNQTTVSIKNNVSNKDAEKKNLPLQQSITNNKQQITTTTYKQDAPIVITRDKKPSNNLPTPPLQIFNKEESNLTTMVNVTPINNENISLTNLNASTNKTTDKATTKFTQPAVYVQPDVYYESSDNRIFYAKEESIKKTKLGGFIKRVKRMVERTANLKPGNSIKIANIEVASL